MSNQGENRLKSLRQSLDDPIEELKTEERWDTLEEEDERVIAEESNESVWNIVETQKKSQQQLQ